MRSPTFAQIKSIARATRLCPAHSLKTPGRGDVRWPETPSQSMHRLLFRAKANQTAATNFGLLEASPRLHILHFRPLHPKILVPPMAAAWRVQVPTTVPFRQPSNKLSIPAPRSFAPQRRWSRAHPSFKIFAVPLYNRLLPLLIVTLTASALHPLQTMVLPPMNSRLRLPAHPTLHHLMKADVWSLF